MKKYFMIWLALVTTILLSACGTKTYEEAIHEAHPNAEILHEIETERGIIILYSEKQDVGAAQLSQGDKGWDVISSNNIGANNNPISFASINKGANDEILFGKINDGNIANVQLKLENGEIKKAIIIGSHQDIWYFQWKYDNAELVGLTKEGKIVYQSTFGID